MLAPVQQLRPSSPPPPRTPEREALRIAIEARATAAQRLAKISDARERASDAAIEASSAVKRATVALKEAKQGASRHLAAVALGEAQGSPVDDATSNLAAAEAHLAAARQTREALDAELTAAERELSTAETRLDDCVRTVASAGMAQLVADYEVACNVFADHCRIMSVLSRLGCAPLARWGGVGDDGSRPDPAAAQEWQAAITALRGDADAELPQS